MSYDHELILITPAGFVEDDIGNQIPVGPVELPLLCKLESVGRAEFYNASSQGMKPEKVFIIHAYEYDGQQLVKFEGKQYRVTRTFQTGTEEIELTCERVVADA